MILYYFPHVDFPYLPHGYIVEEHIIFAAAFILIAFMPEARRFSLSAVIRKKTTLATHPLIRMLL